MKCFSMSVERSTRLNSIHYTHSFISYISYFVHTTLNNLYASVVITVNRICQPKAYTIAAEIFLWKFHKKKGFHIHTILKVKSSENVVNNSRIVVNVKSLVLRSIENEKKWPNQRQIKSRKFFSFYHTIFSSLSSSYFLKFRSEMWK